MSGSVDRKERPPWKPERGQRVRVVGTGSVPEWAAFTAVMTFCICLLIVAVLVFR